MTSVTTASVEDNGEDKFDLVDDPSWDTQLASDKESKLVEEPKILGSMSLLDGPHANFPEVTGEYNLLRFLRGCNGDVKEAANCSRNINLRKEFNLDEMRDRMVSLLMKNRFWSRRPNSWRNFCKTFSKSAFCR